MKLRKLGRTGLEVSEIGFGTWGIGGAAGGDVAYGPTDDAESKAALQRAFELGANFFDTSDLYGFGHSETLLGEVFQKQRKNIIIATKAGFVKRDGGLAQDFSVEHIAGSLEESLRRLKTDYIDLFQLHSPPLDLLDANPALLEALRRFQHEGKIRCFGISVRSPEDALTAVTKFGAAVIQVNFNLVDQRIVENGFMDRAGAEGVGIICRTPLCFGFLGGGYSAETKFDPSDHRGKWSPEQLKVWAEANNAFSLYLRYPGQTNNQLALRFCLSYPAISTVIPGMLTREHVNENLAASSLGPFKDSEQMNLEKVYKQHRFFLGK